MLKGLQRLNKLLIIQKQQLNKEYILRLKLRNILSYMK